MIKALNLKTLISLILISVFGAFLISPNTFAATHSLTLTSSGSQSINVSASSGTAISSDSINVSTTCRYGYNFTINTSVNNNNLYLNGNSSNNASGTYFSPVDGTTALNSSTNKWGYYYNITERCIYYRLHRFSCRWSQRLRSRTLLPDSHFLLCRNRQRDASCRLRCNSDRWSSD